MKFRGFFERALGTKVKARLVEHMLREEAVTSERELARMLGVSHVALNKTLKELHETNLISATRLGNVLVWNVNKESYAYWALTHLKEAVWKRPLDDLKEELRACFKEVRKAHKVVLFGSVAEGTEASASDIDLFILVDGERERTDCILDAQELGSLCLKRYGNKVSLTVLTPKEMRSERYKPLLKSVENGITLKG